MLVVHHLEKSRSHRILWLLEELEVPFSVERYERGRDFRAPKSLRELHPLGKVPIVVDDGEVVVETGAVIEHVLDKYGEGRLVPAAGSVEARDYRFFMHYAEGSLMPPLLVRLIFDKVEGAKLPFFVKPVVRQIADKVNRTFISGEMELHGEFLNGILSRREWIIGDTFSAADIMVSYPIQGLLTRGRLSGSRTGHLAAYVDRMTARPAYRRAVERGGGEPL